MPTASVPLGCNRRSPGPPRWVRLPARAAHRPRETLTYVCGFIKGPVKGTDEQPDKGTPGEVGEGPGYFCSLEMGSHPRRMWVRSPEPHTVGVLWGPPPGGVQGQLRFQALRCPQGGEGRALGVLTSNQGLSFWSPASPH